MSIHKETVGRCTDCGAAILYLPKQDKTQYSCWCRALRPSNFVYEQNIKQQEMLDDLIEKINSQNTEAEKSQQQQQTEFDFEYEKSTNELLKDIRDELKEIKRRLPQRVDNKPTAGPPRSSSRFLNKKIIND